MDDFNVIVEEKTEDSTVPLYGSPEWDKYVMGFFTEDEVIKGNPLTKGLRRVTQLVFGDIVSSKPTQVFPSFDQNGLPRCTVVYEVIIQTSTGIKVFGDVADVWHGNTDDLFLGHCPATASTKAEGRCLRKALMLKCLAAEELTTKDVGAIVKSITKTTPITGEQIPTDSMTDNQKAFIDSRCKKLNINTKYLMLDKCKKTSVNQLTKRDASDILEAINQIQSSGMESMSKEVVGYSSEWMTQ